MRIVRGSVVGAFDKSTGRYETNVLVRNDTIYGTYIDVRDPELEANLLLGVTRMHHAFGPLDVYLMTPTTEFHMPCVEILPCISDTRCPSSIPTVLAYGMDPEPAVDIALAYLRML